MKRKFTLKLASGLLLFFSVNFAFAQTNYYVDPNLGNDGSSGLFGFPKATIQEAINSAVTPAIINIAAGSYAENVVIDKSDITLKGAGAGTHENSAPDAINLTEHTVLSNAAGIGITISGARTNVKITDLIVQGYADGGIKAGTPGCNDFVAERLQILSCGGQAGLMVTGDVNGVTINDVASMNNTGRAIVIWDRYKQNISITKCYVVLGACCGIELQDGTASGVYIANNTIIGGAVGDSGMGLSGLKGGAGPNIIENNTITMSKRYGIELKNPAGTGTETDTEDGAVIVRNNTITRAGAITEVRDLAGIAIFRRAFLANNSYNYLDVPSGVVVVNNSIDGFVQPDAGTGNDGFGVVAEGVRMTIKDNHISNCDIGVQRQSGNSSGYVKNDIGDADQTANDDYFNRGNSPFSSAINVSGNTFTANGLDIRDMFAINTYISDTQYVLNTDQLNAFATIGLAVESATAGNTLQLSANTFDERVIIDKSLTIDGVNNTLAKVTYTRTAITGTGNGIPTIFTANATNITIKNIGFIVNLDKVHSAIHSKGDVSGITITNNRFVAAKIGVLVSGKLAYTRRDAVAINVDPYDVDYQNVNPGISGVTIQKNVVDGFIDGDIANGGFRAGFQVDRAKNVLIGGNTTADGNTVQTISHDVICRFFIDGDVTVKNNEFNGGGVEMSSNSSGLGTVTVENNTFDGSVSNTYTSLARFQFNTHSKAFVLKNNTFSNVNWGISLENFNTITLDGNTFTPSVDNFRLVTINTKSLVTSPATTQKMGVTMVNNIFNGLVGSTNGTAVGFYNHNEDASSNYINNSSYVLGKLGKENSFNTNIKNYILLDNSNAVLTSDAGFQAAYPADYGGIPITTTGYWKKNIIAADNKYDIGSGLALTSNMDLAQKTTLKTFIQDLDDDVNLGEVLIYLPVHNLNTGDAFATIQDAIDAPETTNGNVINADNITYTLTSGININKELTIQGNNNVISNKPLITGSGGTTNKALFYVNAPNVTIQNFHLQFNEQNANSGASISSYGIRTGDNGTFDNLKILDNLIEGTNTAYVFNSYGILLGTQTPTTTSTKVTIQRNKIAHTQANNALGRGIRSWYVDGTIGGSLADKNDIKAFYASMDLSVSGGTNPINVSYNDLFGKFKIGGLRPGNHVVSHNTITSGGLADASAQGIGVKGADLQPALIEVVSARTDLANLEISDNTLNDFKYAGIALFASSNISILNNTFNPLANETGFTHVLFETKTTDSNSESPKALKNLTIKGNNFKSSGAAGGKGLFFANSNGSSSVEPLSLSTIGGADAEANTFSSNLTTYVELDQQSGLSSAIPLWVTQFYDGTTVTNVIPFTSNIDISLNKIDASSLSSFSHASLYSMESKIAHGLDDGITGFVTVKTDTAFTASASEAENAMKVVPDGYTVLVKSGTDLSATTLLAKHSLALSAEDASLTASSIGIDAAGKSLTLNKPVSASALSLSAGKVVTTATNTLTVPASGISFTSEIGNFVDGPLNITGISADQVIPVGKGTKAAYIGLSGISSGPSNFTAEYFSGAYTDVSNKEASLEAVSNNEYWLLNRTSGTLAGSVQLYSFDQSASGLTDFTPTHALVAWYDGTEWKNQGNANFTSNSITASLGNSSFSPFTFATPPSVLPVELISFNAIAKTQGALLTWTTASEKDNDHFEIQKSIDGISFFKVVDLPAGTNSGQVNKYEYLDANFRQSSYYQLVQVNKDGTRKIYANNIKYVAGLADIFTFIAYPNPTLSSLHINYNSEKNEKISGKLIDYLGKTVKTFAGNSKSDIVLDLSKEQPGIYILKMETAQGIQTKAIVKQ